MLPWQAAHCADLTWLEASGIMQGKNKGKQET